MDTLKKSNKSIKVSNDVASFLKTVAHTPAKKTNGNKAAGRLLFALDATASRQPSWDQACELQASMFSTTEQLGGLHVQLCYYRGFNEFYKTGWLDETQVLLTKMAQVRCLGGHTQIAKVLAHAIAETRLQRIQAVVFIGDAMEESPDKLCDLAGQLGLLKTPVFVFHEGFNTQVSSVFRQIARLSGGAYSTFDENSAQQLKELLSAVAIFASGGLLALEKFSQAKSPALKQLTQQLKS